MDVGKIFPLVCKGFPNSITMLGFAFGLLMAVAMATQIYGASLFSDGSPWGEFH